MKLNSTNMLSGFSLCITHLETNWRHISTKPSQSSLTILTTSKGKTILHITPG